ncbi:Myo-inositol transporter permease [Neisseria gonorrhoeae MIA_2011_03-09]|nr:Myo-inositol transporter permease [Neisseria gonorrhoeae MIA_2011_03-09]
MSNPKYVKKETNPLAYFKRFVPPLSRFYLSGQPLRRLKNSGFRLCSGLKPMAGILFFSGISFVKQMVLNRLMFYAVFFLFLFFLEFYFKEI